METYRPISTISYNTRSFLKSTLDKLYKEHLITFYAFIHHFPEKSDEYGRPETKEHFHVFVKPAKKIDTFILKDRFDEPDLVHSELDKPLGCIDFDSSKFFDWFLYALHDVDYLSFKGLKREYHYTVDEICALSDDALNEEIHRCDFTKYKNFKELNRAVSSKQTFASLVQNGFVPIPQIMAYQRAYEVLSQDGEYSTRRMVFLKNGIVSDMQGGTLGSLELSKDYPKHIPFTSKLYCTLVSDEVYDNSGFLIGTLSRLPFAVDVGGV